MCFSIMSIMYTDRKIEAELDVSAILILVNSSLALVTHLNLSRERATKYTNIYEASFRSLNSL